MVFVDKINGDGVITIDGYSRYKSIEAVARDMGRYIAQYVDKEEGESIIRHASDGECWSPASACGGGYLMEAEEVGCASRFNEKKNEMEYTDARWYVVCRIVR